MKLLGQAIVICKGIAWVEEYENCSQGQRSRSNVTNSESLLAFIMVHNLHTSIKLHQFLISSNTLFLAKFFRLSVAVQHYWWIKIISKPSFRDSVRRDRRAPPKTVPARGTVGAQVIVAHVHWVNLWRHRVYNQVRGLSPGLSVDTFLATRQHQQTPHCSRQAAVSVHTVNPINDLMLFRALN